MPEQTPPTPDEQTHSTRVHVIDKQVYVSLPDDAYMRMNPGQAQQLAVQLIRASREARGEHVTGVVVLSLD